MLCARASLCVCLLSDIKRFSYFVGTMGKLFVFDMWDSHSYLKTIFKYLLTESRTGQIKDRQTDRRALNSAHSFVEKVIHNNES